MPGAFGWHSVSHSRCKLEWSVHKPVSSLSARPRSLSGGSSALLLGGNRPPPSSMSSLGY
eukprot:11667753-Alexandrium_andersonii.AAC.1